MHFVTFPLFHLSILCVNMNMMSFYKRSFHSFLGLTPGGTTAAAMSPEGGELPPCKCGLGLINSINSMSSPHVLESSIAGVSLRSPERRDPGGIGFLDEADGLMLCTECLGFESYDDRRVDADELTCRAEDSRMTCHGAEEAEAAAKRMKKEENVAERERNKTFPPPLSSLDVGGKRWFYLQPVRKDGRLEISQVVIQRPEILRASRENGRLRLHLLDGVVNPIRAYDYDFQDCRDSEDECDGQECTKDMNTSTLEYHREMDDDCDDDDDDNGKPEDKCKDMNESLIYQGDQIDQDRVSSHGKREEIVDQSVRSYDIIDSGDACDCYDDGRNGEEYWRYKSACHDVFNRSDHHDHDDHHHTYHQCNHNHNMQLWSQRYVTTR